MPMPSEKRDLVSKTHLKRIADAEAHENNEQDRYILEAVRNACGKCRRELTDKQIAKFCPDCPNLAEIKRVMTDGGIENGIEHKK